MSCSPATNVLSTTLQLPPGTHHVKFIVDGEMQLSDELPTAVDFTNILVNYIEVSADDIPKELITEFRVPEGVFPPLVLPPEIDAEDHAPDSVRKGQTVEGEKPTEPVFWGEDVPRYLIDLDLGEHSRRYQRAARGVAEFPTPPSLPLFLGKSILNGTTPMKDDSSVLIMPNHTVLNHLATSSIRHQVLATSVTTRYKRKVRLYVSGMNSAADAGEVCHHDNVQTYRRRWRLSSLLHIVPLCMGDSQFKRSREVMALLDGAERILAQHILIESPFSLRCESRVIHTTDLRTRRSPLSLHGENLMRIWYVEIRPIKTIPRGS